MKSFLFKGASVTRVEQYTAYVLFSDCKLVSLAFGTCAQSKQTRRYKT